MEPVTDFIVDFFVEKGKFRGLEEAEFTDVNFVENNILDSIEFITLISEIEENFDLVLTQEDIQSPAFSSIAGMVKIINLRISE